MKVLLFTHKNDIDGMGNVVLARLGFSKVNYELCGTFDLTDRVLKYYDDGSIYSYDRIFVTDLCIEDPVLSKVAADERLRGKFFVFDHHKTFTAEKYTRHSFIKVQIEDDKGLCSGTSLFYEYLTSQGVIDSGNLAIKEFVELTRQHDTWEWKNIYNNEKARELATLFDVYGCTGYINFMSEKLSNKEYETFEFDDTEKELIANRFIQVAEKVKMYAEQMIVKDILGLKAGIVFITYEYRNEFAEYLRENKYDVDFAMMISIDPKVVSYRSVKNGVNVRMVAEAFGGKGHDKAATNPITSEMINKILEILTKQE